MRKYGNKSPLSLSKVLAFFGKPLFLVFTIVVIVIAGYFHLLLIFLRKISSINLPPINFPKISISLPKFSFSFPILLPPNLKLSIPKINLSTYIITINLLLISISIYYLILHNLPSVTLLANAPPALTTKIYDRNGNLLYQIYKDQNRSLVSLSSLPQNLIDATIAAEDKNFYNHFGIDPTGIIRAIYNNVSCFILHDSCFRSPQGGSTLTQQLIKNTLLTPEKTLTRKLKELVLSIQTELSYNKDQILEMYFNQVPYGGTAYGIEEAAYQYLGKHAKDLTLSESAFLAGLPVSPTTLSPFGTTPYLAQIRQQQVLESMVKLNMITENEKVQAVNTPIHLISSNTKIRAPHFVMYVRDLLVKEFGEGTVSRGGLQVTTTLDLSIQETLQSQVITELDKLSNLNVQNGAGMIVNPPTGEILAMVGSHNFFDTEHDGQVNVTLQPRQPGSSIKPLTYALAFMKGLAPSSIIEDSPICFKSKGSPDYCPKNYDNKFHGSVSLKTALASSYNIPAIKLLNSLGITNLIELARSMGITTWDDSSRFGLSLTLGGGEVKMYDLVQAYSVFANNGYKIPLNSILEIRDSNNQLLTMNHKSLTKQQILPESIAFQINSILSDNFARSGAFGANSVLNIKGHTVAVKTGTTNNLRDNWTIGYTPSYLVATWVGNNDNSSMSSVASGITGASPIWSRTITELLKEQPNLPFPQPSTIVKALVNCEPKRYDYFVKGTEPKIDCSLPPGQIL